MQEITTKIEYIGPERARELMALNIDNRHLSRANLERLTKEIRKGNYKFNGDSIKISKTGRLLDGQHRLQAIINTGETLKILVICGLEDEVFDTLDQGSTRTLGHMLSQKKIKNFTVAAAIIPLLITYRKGNIPHASYNLSKTDLLKEFYKEPCIEEAAHYAAINSGHLRKWLSPAWVGFLYVILKEQDPNRVKYFLDRIATGSGLEVTDTEWRLREKLIQIASSSGIKDTLAQRAAYVIRAWNAVRTNKSMKYFSYKQTGGKAESFPQAK